MVKKVILIIMTIYFVHISDAPAQNISKIECKDSVEIILVLDAWPEYNSKGAEGLLEFIRNNIKPIKIPNDDCKVIIQFTVDTLGNTSNHKVIKSVNKELDDEALRVSKLIKFYKPAFQNGKPVNVVFTLPLDYKNLNSSN